MKRLGLILASMMILAGLILSSCAPKPAEAHKLKLALLPIVDALPIYVAQEAGYFAAEGIEVEFIPAASAAERDQLMAAGQADGMINDPVAAALFNRVDTQVQVVRIMRSVQGSSPMYRILASPKSGITDAQGLKGVPIGISEGSIIAYVTDQLLLANGLQAGDIQTIAVPKISDRMALLNSGEIQAATLPEPFSTLALLDGAVVILDDSANPGLGDSVLTFRKTALEAQPETVKSFLKAVEQAVASINNEPEKWRDMLGKYNLVPAPLQPTFPIPAFPTAGVLTQDQFDRAVQWAVGKELLDRQVPYAESVSGEYLPK